MSGRSPPRSPSAVKLDEVRPGRAARTIVGSGLPAPRLLAAESRVASTPDTRLAVQTLAPLMLRMGGMAVYTSTRDLTNTRDVDAADGRYGSIHFRQRGLCAYLGVAVDAEQSIAHDISRSGHNLRLGEVAEVRLTPPLHWHKSFRQYQWRPSATIIARGKEGHTAVCRAQVLTHSQLNWRWHCLTVTVGEACHPR